MFVILTYDVNKKRVSKVMKLCRKYLLHVQNSVFEGNLSPAQLQRLKRELSSAIIPSVDSVQIYRLESTRFVEKESIGVSADLDSVIG